MKKPNKTDLVHIDCVSAQTGEIVTTEHMPASYVLLCPTPPRDWRALCGAAQGYFTANNRMQGNSLAFRLLAFREEHDVKFSDVYPEPETVMQCVVIDEQRVVGTLIWRASGLAEFRALLLELQLCSELPVRDYILEATLTRVTNSKGYAFYVPRFSYVASPLCEHGDLQTAVDGLDIASTFRDLPRLGGVA